LPDDARFEPPDAPLDEEFDVRRAGLVVVEAVLVGVLERIECKVPGAACVGAVQKRTMATRLRHKSAMIPYRLSAAERMRPG
jgi:hypothetical protein